MGHDGIRGVALLHNYYENVNLVIFMVAFKSVFICAHVFNAIKLH